MQVIERIGQFTIAQHGHTIVAINRKDRGFEVYQSANEARQEILEKVDLVDRFNVYSSVRDWRKN